MPAMSTYLSRLSSPCEKEPKEGHLPIFKWRRWWPNVDGANPLSWNFIGIPHEPIIQPLFLSYYFLAEFPSGAWVPTKPANFAWASKIGPGQGVGASVPPFLRENGKTPATYIGGDWYSM